MSKQTFVSFFFVRFLEILEHVKVFHSGKLFGKFLKNCATQMGNILKKAWWNLCESESNYGPRRSLKAVAKESSKFFSVELLIHQPGSAHALSLSSHFVRRSNFKWEL